MIARQVLTRLLVAVVLRALLIAACFLFSSLRLFNLGYMGLALLFLWYLYIPLLWTFVSMAWPIVQWLFQMRRARTFRT